MTRATRIGVALAAGLLVALAASGAWLWWNYFPGSDAWIRVVHQVAAVALLVIAVGLVIVAIVHRAGAGARGIVAAVGVLASVGAAYVVGRLLPWDQVALWAVTTKREMRRGVDLTFDDRIKYLIVRGHEVAVDSYHRWAYAHLVLSALVVVALVMVWLRTRERGVSPPPTQAPEPESEPVG